MASDYNSGLMPRTYFKAPRVPFDFRALSIAILGYLVFWAGGALLNWIFGKQDVTGAFLMWFAELFAGVPFIGEVVRDVIQRVFQIDVSDGDYTFWHGLVGGLWFLVVWAFFGQAIHRITSLRIARDEGLTIGEALSFGAKNGLSIVRAPLIIMAVMGAFFLCNALAGLLMSIPIVGGVLAIVLVPLAIVATILILLVGLGGVFGLPLIGASAAWEVNGSLDAISRAFSYVFARPLQYFWNFLLIFLFVGVVLLVGNWFIYTMMKSISFGSMSDVQTVMIDAPAKGSVMDTEDADLQDLSEAAQNLASTLREHSGFTGQNETPEPSDVVRIGVDSKDGSQLDFVLRTEGPGSPTVEVVAPPSKKKKSGPFARSVETIVHAPWTYKLNAIVLWICTNLVWLGIYGYAIYWLIGAATSVYADLRADVDGTGEDEIYLEDEDEAFEALAESGPTSEAGVAAAETATAEAAAGEVDAPAEESSSEAEESSEDEGDDAESKDEA